MAGGVCARVGKVRESYKLLWGSEWPALPQFLLLLPFLYFISRTPPRSTNSSLSVTGSESNHTFLPLREMSCQEPTSAFTGLLELWITNLHKLLRSLKIWWNIKLESYHAIKIQDHIQYDINSESPSKVISTQALRTTSTIMDCLKIKVRFNFKTIGEHKLTTQRHLTN